jgi:hypothetical protein
VKKDSTANYFTDKPAFIKIKATQKRVAFFVGDRAVAENIIPYPSNICQAILRKKLKKIK